jgi:hypothetical protein
LYRIDNIGREFSRKGREALETNLNAAEREGWEFHSVFSVTESTCLGLSKLETYYMVLRKR